MRSFVAIMTCLLVMGGNTIGRDLAAKPLQIEGAKVSAQADAKRIAFEAYAKKMRAEILANESVQDMAVVTLGYDVPGFASKGERIWEARVLTIEGGLRAILWVNPRSEDVHYVCGPWEAKIE
ncbi:MAG: hypothetical protein RBS99_15785 [Rhodospirillales bacterium]|nr:hypothetical protein [Rhodospirillales bacterium]